MGRKQTRHRKAIKRGRRFLILCEGQRAKKLLEEHAGEPPHRQNPVTTVYELVEELLKAGK